MGLEHVHKISEFLPYSVMSIYLTEDNFKVTNQYFSFQCVLFRSRFDWKNMIFLDFPGFFPQNMRQFLHGYLE